MHGHRGIQDWYGLKTLRKMEFKINWNTGHRSLDLLLSGPIVPAALQRIPNDPRNGSSPVPLLYCRRPESQT